ncbi:fibrinogen-like YCDxxxxGGGW domain-containing protein [Pseudoalteromonas luteoviolacea]|uniref:Fibrinogen C-terminal domain-containing protein n=1 Tax=Pseudoalteromonas luteoviolacea S4060-1 TaxID=1365257 RepID=A0A167NA21_9GAMM|nr:fibrinogen-like YCDxxxxGGGW domain-containing protein [Pseudoalteromonas luteoviolacea]KZN67809.1 hypothetical protein N478_16435 [Pseudoalteromonas luteoviolacea S4060-1]
MNQLTALILATLSTSTLASNTQWELLTDTQLNGVLDSSTSQLQTLTLTTYANQFNAVNNASPDASVIQGEFELPNTFELGSGVVQRIQFTIANEGKRVYFLGQGSAQQGYRGTWYGPNNDAGDFRLDTKSAEVSVPVNCAQILSENPEALSGVYTIDPDGAGAHAQFEAYCDMETDEGGWTLIGTYSKSEPGGKQYISDYSPQPDTTPTNPTATGLYQGSLGAFRDIREQVACDFASCRNAYQTAMSEAELDMVRYTWGYLDQQEKQKNTPLPDCRATYQVTGTAFTHCLINTDRNNTNVVGWQRDIHAGNHSCWLAHGVYRPTSLGSSRCSYLAQANGTRWGLLWAR